jgi:hypothetical protein
MGPAAEIAVDVNVVMAHLQGATAQAMQQTIHFPLGMRKMVHDKHW